MKLFSQPAFAALILVVAGCAWSSSSAQQTDGGLLHVRANSMSAADQATLERDHDRLAEAAAIYGYNLAAGNWDYQQTICSAMPDTILLHYWREFPDGSESLFTALVPRGAGSVRIVPVLYRNTTPFVPAPKNPRNYALFNEFVSGTVADGGAVSNKKWIELSACYAEMTGASIDLPLHATAEIGIAGAPSPTIHARERGGAARVTLATRDGEDSYRVWSVAFDRKARVTAVVTEDRTVSAAVASPQIEPVPVVEKPRVTASARSAAGVAPQSSARVTAMVPDNAAASARAIVAAPVPANAVTTPGRETVTAQSSDEPGWKSILHPADPPARLVPQAPPPPEKIIPEPPDENDQSATPQH